MAVAATLSPLRGGDVNYRYMRPFDDAAWVWLPEPSDARFFRFRNDFDSDGSALTLYVSADERYVLMLDGEEVSRGPARGMPTHWFCQKVSITPKPGSHRLEAVVWTLGKGDSPHAQLTLGGGFLLKAEGVSDEALTTGKGYWRVAPLRGTVTDGRSYEDAFGGGTQFRVSGTSCFAEMPPDTSWASVRPVFRPKNDDASGVVQPGWCVYESALPEMMMRSVKPGEIPRDRIEVPARSRRELLFDLGDYYCAYPYLTVSGGKGSQIRFGWTEALLDAQGRKIHRDSRNGAFSHAVIDTFLPDGRIQAVFTVPWWRCGKWCRIEIETADEPLTVDDITLKETRYPLEISGGFAAEGDDTLAAISRLCVRGVEMCAHEIMFDCPFYEQQMYPGDVLMSFAALRTMTSDLRLPLQGLALFDAARMPSGLVPMNWPCQGDQRSSTWTLSWVAAVGEIAMWGGEGCREWLKDRYPGVTQTLMAYARIEDEKGLLIDPPGWNFLDWTKGWEPTEYTPPNGRAGKGPDACINLLYLQAMDRMAELSLALDEPDQARFWQKRAARLAAAIRATFWDESRGLIADTPAKASYCEHAQALAITTSCLPDAMRDRAFEGLTTAPDLARASYMLHMVFSAYFRYGRGDLFLKKLDQWRDYVKMGLRCPLEAPQFPRSDCHAFASTPYYHFHTGLAGVRPAAPFFGKVRVSPAPGGLRRIAARTPHPKGVVETDFRFDPENGVRGSVTLPAGVDGEFTWQGVRQALGPGRNDISQNHHNRGEGEK